MNKYMCNKIVFSSSATIYKANNIDLINEKCEKGPINPYGNTKRMLTKYFYQMFLKVIKINGE